MRIRKRSATASKVELLNFPRRRTSRSEIMERTSSHLIKLTVATPPSGGTRRTWERMPLSRLVIGNTISKPAGLRLKRSWEITKQGRVPFCSCPRTGSRSISQTSPRSASTNANHSPAHRPWSHPKLCALLVLPPIPPAFPATWRNQHLSPPGSIGNGSPQPLFPERFALVLSAVPLIPSICAKLVYLSEPSNWTPDFPPRRCVTD